MSAITNIFPIFIPNIQLMYTVYINDTPLHFAEKAELPPKSDQDKSPVYHDMTGGRLAPNCVDMLEKSTRFDAMYLVGEDPKKRFDYFAKNYKIIEAAGGLVVNELDEILIIYRLDTYDLPKGKMEKDEIPRETAHREVEEETGVKHLITNDLLGLTYHTYRSRKNKRILKRTYWFKMTAPKQPLTPQAEEDIEKAEWIAPKDIPKLFDNMYESIKMILVDWISIQ